MSLTRRTFLRYIGMLVFLSRFLAVCISILTGSKRSLAMSTSVTSHQKYSGQSLGVDPDGLSRVYLVKNGSPEKNIEKVIEMMGGIERFVGRDDILILKPNAQWWGQGMTNTDAMMGFIDLVLRIPGFKGELIIAENHQYTHDNSRGWTTQEKNGRFNLNELVDYFQQKGHKNVTKCHWHVAGSCREVLEGDGQGVKRITGPQDGDGYVWMTDSPYISPRGRKCLMTYPVFTSAYSGIKVDLKKGAWDNGKYLDKKTKLINFSAINHHTRYGGVTASVKNLMGVVDMTCGWPGDQPQDTYNVHHVGVSRLMRYAKWKWHWRLEKYKYLLEDYCTRDFHHAGGALGHFMNYVRMPDLNIITAIHIGWGSRTDKSRSFTPNAVLASTDPVALDYTAAKEILLPGTPSGTFEKKSGIEYRVLNDPDREDGPFRKFLNEAHKQGIGNFNKSKITLITDDLGSV